MMDWGVFSCFILSLLSRDTFTCLPSKTVRSHSVGSNSQEVLSQCWYLNVGSGPFSYQNILFLSLDFLIALGVEKTSSVEHSQLPLKLRQQRSYKGDVKSILTVGASLVLIVFLPTVLFLKLG